MKLKIKYKIILSFTLVLVLSFIIQTIAYKITDNYISEEIGLTLIDKADLASNQIEGFFSQVEQDHLSITKAYIEDKSTEYSDTSLIAKHVLKQNSFYEKITILSKSGKENLAFEKNGKVNPQSINFEIPTIPFQQAIAGQTSISKVYYTDNSIPKIDIFTPIVAESGAITGAVKSQLNLERLWDIIAQIKLGETGFVYIVDDEGRLIAHPNSPYLQNSPNLTSNPVVKPLLENTQGISKIYIYKDENGEPVIANGKVLTATNWLVISQESKNEAYSARNILRTLYIVTILTSTVLLILISLFLSKRITNSIDRLIQMANKIEKGNLDVKVSINSKDELQDLAASLNIMSTQLKNAFTQLHQKVDELENKREELAATTNQLKSQETTLRQVNSSAEKEKEQAEAERNKLQILLAGINDGVIAVDLDRKIILFNPAAERITGYKAEEVMGSHVQTIIKIFDNKEEVPVDTFCPQVIDRFEGVVYKKEKVVLTGKSSKRSYVDLISGHIREGMNINLGSIITFHDITHIEELERMKLDFVSMAAHELRTPLTTVLGYLSFLQDEKVTDKLTEQEKEFLKRVNLSASRLNMLIENLLVVSRIEQGTMVLHPEPISLDTISDKLVKEFTGLAHTKGLKLNLVKMNEPLSKVNADPARIEEVISNLIGNAINYTQKGSVTVTLEQKGNEVIFSVQDTGQGIPDEAIPSLFTKFFRIQGKLESGSKGTGLGLYISKNIIDAHKGRIWVESKLGAGSIFRFALPALPNS